MYLGAHLGIADGLDQAVRAAREIGCDSLQIFSKSPQMWSGPPLPADGVERFRRAVSEFGLQATAVHHGYLANLASPKPAGLRQSVNALRDELERARALGVDALILHPGAHLGSGVDAGVKQITKTLNTIFEATPDGTPRLLLENAAGQGSTIGSRFEELASILSGITDRSRVGITLDTCHLFAAGYDFRTDETYGEVIDAIGSTFGLSEVRAFHLNDSKQGLGSHLDRHENIGRGAIGLAGFIPWLNDRRWARVPGFLETPLDDRGYARYAEDLTTLRSLLAAPPAARRSSRGRSLGRSREAARGT